MSDLCLIARCEDQALVGSDYCERHQNVGRGEQHESYDAELHRLRSKLSRIRELVEKWSTSDPYQSTATLNAIREELER